MTDSACQLPEGHMGWLDCLTHKPILPPDWTSAKSLYVKTDFGQIEGNWHDLWQRMAAIFAAKNADYGAQDADPYYNFRKATQLGIEPWRGALIRMADKWARIESFAQKGSLEVSDESFEDTCMDLAVYCLIEIVLHREAHETT